MVRRRKNLRIGDILKRLKMQINSNGIKISWDIHNSIDYQAIPDAIKQKVSKTYGFKMVFVTSGSVPNGSQPQLTWINKDLLQLKIPIFLLFKFHLKRVRTMQELVNSIKLPDIGQPKCVLNL